MSRESLIGMEQPDCGTAGPNSRDPELCGHIPAAAHRLDFMLETLYRAGFGYHEIGDLTNLCLSHREVRAIITNPDDRAREALIEQRLGES